MSERTLILIKPDALQRGLVGNIIKRFENKGLKIVSLKMFKMSEEQSKEHYSHLVDKDFYPDLEDFITNYPLIAMVVEGKNAIEVVRNIVGVTNASKADAGTVRGDFSNSTARNVIHASDSKESAKREINRFFDKDEIFDYDLVLKDLLYAPDEIE